MRYALQADHRWTPETGCIKEISLREYLDCISVPNHKTICSKTVAVWKIKPRVANKKKWPDDVFEVRGRDFKRIGDENTVDVSGWIEIPMSQVGFDEASKYHFSKNWNTGDYHIGGITSHERNAKGGYDGYALLLNSYAKLYTDGEKKYYVGGFTIL